MTLAYYNEIDPHAAEHLRNLISAGHIAPGDVDERDIRDVRADDLRGYVQVHLFAGVGVWSYALRLAGWPDGREIWTGSCPCQPFSIAGKGEGVADKRHLWPELYRLLRECHPDVIAGEQVASPAGLAWLDAVSTDLENEGYTCGAVDLCSAGVGAPHIRQRLHWVGVADADRPGPARFGEHCRKGAASKWLRDGFTDSRQLGRLADSDGERFHGQQVPVQPGQPRQADAETPWSGGTGGLADANGTEEHQEQQGPAAIKTGWGAGEFSGCGMVDPDCRTGPSDGFWRAADWLFCRDGRWRPVEPGTFPLAHGAPSRVGRLRTYGNAINAEVAKEFIKAVMEILP